MGLTSSNSRLGFHLNVVLVLVVIFKHFEIDFFSIYTFFPGLELCWGFVVRISLIVLCDFFMLVTKLHELSLKVRGLVFTLLTPACFSSMV